MKPLGPCQVPAPTSSHCWGWSWSSPPSLRLQSSPCHCQEHGQGSPKQSKTQPETIPCLCMPALPQRQRQPPHTSALPQPAPLPHVPALRARGDTRDCCERQRCHSHVVTCWGSAWLPQGPSHQSWSLPVSLPWEKASIQPAAMGWPQAGCAVPRVLFPDDALGKQRSAAGSRGCGTARLSSGARGHQGASTVPFGWLQLLYGSGRYFLSWGRRARFWRWG